MSFIKFPPTNDIKGCEKVHVVEGNIRVMQRIYATHNFYGYGKPRLDIVMLYAVQKKYCGGYKSEIRFGKVLGVMKMKRKAQQRPETTLCVEHEVNV